MPHSPPLPIFADKVPLEDKFWVQFDRELRADPVLDIGNWSVAYQLVHWNVVAAECEGDRVTLSVIQAMAAAPGDVVSFAPPPFDVIGRNWVPAPAFTDYPIGPPP